MSRIPVLLSVLLLAGWTGCQRKPSPPVVVEVPGPTKYVPIREELTRPCPIEEPRSTAPLEAARVAKARKNSLEACNRDKAAIRAVQGTKVP